MDTHYWCCTRRPCTTYGCESLDANPDASQGQ
jgi:hypothetical protein